MEEVADAVGRGLEDDLGPVLLGNRLQHAGSVALRIRPERDLRAVEQLDRARPPHALCACRADLVAAVQFVEEQLLRVRRARRRPNVDRAVLVIAVHHLEQVLRCRVLVRQDERANPASPRRAVVEPAAHVGAAPLLPPLEDQRPNPSRPRPLLLQALVDVLLRPVEEQRLLSAILCADGQAVAGVELKVVPQP